MAGAAKEHKKTGKLVVSRFPGEWIDIGEDIQICIEEIRAGQKVRVGIIAPPGVLILRRELKGRGPKPKAEPDGE